jgi:hypothetical protein
MAYTAGSEAIIMGPSEVEPISVILLAGVARSGKDTAARFLVAHHDFQRLAFADGIRAAFSAVSGPSWDLHKEVEAGGPGGVGSLRKLMQIMGTECREDMNCPDHWIDQVGIIIRYLSHYHPVPRRRFVITDFRYPREMSILRDSLDWMENVTQIRPTFRMESWKIVRPDVEPIAESGHTSETSVASIVADRTIVNSGTKEQLAGRVAAAFEAFEKDGVQ